MRLNRKFNTVLEEYKRRLEDDEVPANVLGQVMDLYGIVNPCCREEILSAIGNPIYNPTMEQRVAEYKLEGAPLIFDRFSRVTMLPKDMYSPMDAVSMSKADLYSEMLSLPTGKDPPPGVPLLDDSKDMKMFLDQLKTEEREKKDKIRRQREEAIERKKREKDAAKVESLDMMNVEVPSITVASDEASTSVGSTFESIEKNTSTEDFAQQNMEWVRGLEGREAITGPVSSLGSELMDVEEASLDDLLDATVIDWDEIEEMTADVPIRSDVPVSMMDIREMPAAISVTGPEFTPENEPPRAATIADINIHVKRSVKSVRSRVLRV